MATWGRFCKCAGLTVPRHARAGSASAHAIFRRTVHVCGSFAASPAVNRERPPHEKQRRARVCKQARYGAVLGRGPSAFLAMHSPGVDCHHVAALLDALPLCPREMRRRRGKFVLETPSGALLQNGAFTPAQVGEQLGVNALKGRQWHVQVRSLRCRRPLASPV